MPEGRDATRRTGRATRRGRGRGGRRRRWHRRARCSCVATLLAGCTVGPSQRPPVAVRGEHMPAPPASAPPPAAAPVPLPVPQPGFPTIEFRDCTGTLATAVPTPADRVLRVGCALLTVEADPAQPGLGRTRIGLLRVGLADAPADRPPLLVVGDSATRASATGAATLAGQVPVELLQRYTLVGIDRRGAGIDDLDCGPAVARSAFVNIDPGGDGTLTPLNALLEQARHGRPGLLPRPRGRAERLPHGLHGVGHRAGRGRRSGVTQPVGDRRRRRRHRAEHLGADPPRRRRSARPRRPAERRAGRARRRRGAARPPPSRRSTPSPRPAPPSPPARSAPTPVRSVSAFVDRLRSAADHRDRRSAADRGHDRHRAPHRPRRARGLARPRRRARPGAERRARRPDQPPRPAGHPRRRVRRRARDRLQRRAAADDAGRGRRADPPVAHRRIPLFGATMAQRLLACGPWPTAAAAAGARPRRPAAPGAGDRHGARPAGPAGELAPGGRARRREPCSSAGRAPAPVPTRGRRASPPPSTRCSSTGRIPLDGTLCPP